LVQIPRLKIKSLGERGCLHGTPVINILTSGFSFSLRSGFLDGKENITFSLSCRLWTSVFYHFELQINSIMVLT